MTTSKTFFSKTLSCSLQVSEFTQSKNEEYLKKKNKKHSNIFEKARNLFAIAILYVYIHVLKFLVYLLKNP